MTAQASPPLPDATPMPVALRHRRLRLAAGTPIAARAAAAVRELVAEWSLPVDRALAAALASDLVISAAVNGDGESLMLSVRSTGAEMRVEVHDASVRGDSWEMAPGPQAQRGLLLAAACATDSGRYRTPAGLAVFYVLKFPPPAAAADGGQPREGEQS
jgi:hypothetical protein